MKTKYAPEGVECWQRYSLNWIMDGMFLNSLEGFPNCSPFPWYFADPVFVPIATKQMAYASHESSTIELPTNSQEVSRGLPSMQNCLTLYSKVVGGTWNGLLITKYGILAAEAVEMGRGGREEKSGWIPFNLHLSIQGMLIFRTIAIQISNKPVFITALGFFFQIYLFFLQISNLLLYFLRTDMFMLLLTPFLSISVEF